MRRLRKYTTKRCGGDLYVNAAAKRTAKEYEFEIEYARNHSIILNMFEENIEIANEDFRFFSEGTCFVLCLYMPSSCYYSVIVCRSYADLYTGMLARSHYRVNRY